MENVVVSRSPLVSSFAPANKTVWTIRAPSLYRVNQVQGPVLIAFASCIAFVSWHSASNAGQLTRSIDR